MMKISVILSFLLCWSFVSPNPHHEKSNDRSVGESNHINDGSDTLTLGKEYSEEVSTGKDWGNFLNFLKFFNHKDLDNIDKIHQADNEFFLEKLIHQGSNFFKTLISNNKLSDNPLFGNIIAWIQKNVEAISKLFSNKDNDLINLVSKIKESAFVNEKIENNNRAKRDLKASTSGLLWANPHKGGISEHLLKLNDGSKVLKSEKATVAEALNGRAAISRILAQAKAKAAKAAQHKNLYDNDDFSKWLLSQSSFDTNIFKHPSQSSDNTKIIDNNKNNHSETENTDNQHTFSISHHESKAINHDHHHEIKHTLPDSTAIGIANTDRSYTKLLHKSEHQKHLSSKLQSTSGENHGHDTNEIHKLTVSRHMHGLSSYGDEEDTGLRHTSSHAPHTHFRITKDQETGNNIPKRKQAKWMHTDSSRAHASHASHSAESYDYETSDEREGYGRKFIFKTSFEPGEDDERIDIGYRRGHKFSEEINIHEGDETNYDHLADSLFHGLSIESHHDKNIRNKNKQTLDKLQHSIIHSTKAKKGIENKQSENMLITKISTGISTRKPVNIEHYQLIDQNVVANSATTFSSNLSDDKKSKYTNNVLTPSSIDNGSATIETKTKNDSVLERTHSIINNNATSTRIEIGSSEIKSHPPVASSHSKIYLGNQKVHHIINESSTANTVASKTEHLMDSKMLMENQNKHHDLKANQEITANVVSSTERMPSVIREHHRAISSDQQISDEEGSVEEVSDEEVLDEENYIKVRRKYMDHAGHKTSIEVIKLDDNSAEVFIPEFPVHKHGKAHVIHDINYYDSDDQDDQETSNEKIESVKDLKRIQIDYDNSEKEEMFSDNIKISKESQMNTANDPLSHDQYSQHRKNDKNNQHNYGRHYDKQNHHKNNSQYDNHNIYNQHKYQNNHHILNKQANSMKSSTASDATELDTWNKYIYFIEEQKHRNNESNTSLESSASVKKSKKQNAKHDKTLLNRKGKKYLSDEDKQHYLKKHTNLFDPIMHSTEIDKITLTNDEEKIKSGSNTKNKSKVVTQIENLISDDSKIDTTSHTKYSNKQISNNNNNYYSQTSWELMSLKNPHADVQTETEHIYDTYGGNKNVDINTKQIAKVVKSIESKNNLQSASSKTSESDTKKIVSIKQALNEKISSSDITNDYQDYNDKISDSSKLISKSQMDTIRHSNKKLKSTHEINANTLTKISSLNDMMDKSRSNIQNSIDSSKSSAKSQIGFWDYWNNKKYNTNAEASADAISVDVKNRQKSILGNTSIFSNLSVNSEEESSEEKHSNDLKNAINNSVKSEVLSEVANKSSTESKMKTKQIHYNNAQRDANVKISSTNNNVKNKLFSPSRISLSKSDLTNNKENQINSISKLSAESMLPNIIKDKNQSHLQESLSSSSLLSSEKSQTEYEHNNLQKGKTNISTAEVQSTAFNNNNNGYWSDLSKLSLSSKWLKEKHIKNKHYSNNIKVDHKDNIDVITDTEETSSDNVINSHQQETVNSLSSSSSSAKSQILNKNTKTIITSNNVFDMDAHNSLHASSSLQTASKNNLNVHKNDPQTADTLTMSALINNDKYRREDNILKAKWLTNLTNKNNIDKFTNNKSIEKDEIIQSKLENALNAATSIKTITSTDIENVMNASSSSNSKAKSWTHNEHDLNQLKKEKIIINDLIGAKISNNIENNHENKLLAISSLSDLHSSSKEKKKNHMDIMENNQKLMNTVKSKSLFSTDNKESQNNFIKETTLSEISKEAQRKRNNFNMSKEKSEDIAEITMETLSNSVNNIYHNDNLLKDISISNKKIQTSNKIKDENDEKDEINADNSDTESEIYSKQIKSLKGDNNINKLSMDLATLNSFNSENRNNILKVTPDDLYAEMSQRAQHKSNILSNNRIANINIQDKHRHGLISSTDTKIQSMIDPKSDILRKKEGVNSEIHNINKWNTKFQTKISSSSNAESQNKKKTVVSAESTANNINKNSYDPMQEKSVFSLTNIAKGSKQHNDNEKIDVINSEKARARISNSQLIEHSKDDTKEKTLSQQNKLKHHKIITSNIELSEETNSSEMENEHQELLKDVTTSNSRTKVQHEHINDIVKESLEVTGSAATSAQTKSFEKVESKSQEKSIKDTAKSNSYAKSQIENKNDSSASKEGQIIASIETLKNSAIFNNLNNIRQNKLNKNLLSDPEFHDKYTKNENSSKILKNKSANVADAIVSKEISSNIIKNKYENDIKMISNKASLSNSYAETQAIKRGYNSNFQGKSIQTTSSSDMKEHVRNKNTAINTKKNLQAVTNTVTSVISSNSIEDTSTPDPSKILSSSNLYTVSQMDNVHSRNVAQDGQKRIFTATLPTSVFSINNQDKQKDILHIQDPTNQRITKTKHSDNNFLGKIYNNEDVLSRATSFSNAKNEHQNNLLKSLAETQSTQKDESSIHRKQQHLITTDSITSSLDSNISGYINSVNKNDLEKLTESSSNSYAKSNAQNKNHLDNLKKKHTDILNANRSEQAISNEFKVTKQDKFLRTTSSSDSYTETEMKNDNNNIKKALDAVLNAKIKTVPFNDIKNTDPHNSNKLLINSPAKKLIENKNNLQKDVIKKNLSKTSSDLFSKTQVENAYNSKILKDDYKNSATVNTMIKTKNSNYHNEQEDLHKTRFLSNNAQDNHHNIESISSENSYVTIPTTNENIVKSRKAKKDGEIMFNLSTLGKMEIHNKIKKEHLNNWPITMSDTAILAEERTENKDKFNDTKRTEKVAVCTGKAAVTDNIESDQHDIQVKDRSKLKGSWNAETKIQNAILDASDEMISLKRIKNKNKKKSILNNKLASSNENAKTQIINEEKYGILDSSESFANTEKTKHLIRSAMSTESASTSSNMNIDLGTNYDQINNKMSTTSLTTSISKNAKGREKHLSSVQSSKNLSDKINRCDKDVETREFISQATNLYKILGKRQESEILLMKKNSKGPVQIASFKNSVPPLIAYRLVPREVYEKIRTILANKKIFCTDCPLSNN